MTTTTKAITTIMISERDGRKLYFNRLGNASLIKPKTYSATLEKRNNGTEWRATLYCLTYREGATGKDKPTVISFVTDADYYTVERALLHIAGWLMFKVNGIT